MCFLNYDNGEWFTNSLQHRRWEAEPQGAWESDWCFEDPDGRWWKLGMTLLIPTHPNVSPCGENLIRGEIPKVIWKE